MFKDRYRMRWTRVGAAGYVGLAMRASRNTTTLPVTGGNGQVLFLMLWNQGTTRVAQEVDRLLGARR